MFCTATQPAFEKRQEFNGIENIYPLIDDPSKLYQKTRRVDYHLLNDLNPIDYRGLIDAVIEEDAATLVIFNIKKEALEFYNHSKDIGSWEKRYHLSTSMCPSHRKVVIKNIRDDLKAERKILVVSTQLIEAGVDFDFPVVFRAMARLRRLFSQPVVAIVKANLVRWVER